MGKRSKTLALVLLGAISVHALAQLVDERAGSFVLMLACAVFAVAPALVLVGREDRVGSATLALVGAVLLQWMFFAYVALAWVDAADRRYLLNAQLGLFAPATFVLAVTSVIVCAILRRRRPLA